MTGHYSVTKLYENSLNRVAHFLPNDITQVPHLPRGVELIPLSDLLWAAAFIICRLDDWMEVPIVSLVHDSRSPEKGLVDGMAPAKVSFVSQENFTGNIQRVRGGSRTTTAIIRWECNVIRTCRTASSTRESIPWIFFGGPRVSRDRSSHCVERNAR